MLNFEFLKKDQKYSAFTSACIEAEKSIIISNAATAILTRKALELAVKWVYSFDDYLKLPYEVTLSTLIHDYTFNKIIDPALFPKLRYIQKLGNKAVHSSEAVTREQAVLALKNLYEFISWIDYCYSEELHDKGFESSLLVQKTRQSSETVELQRLKESLKKKEKNMEMLSLENESLRKQFREMREENTQKRTFKVDEISEYQTRKMYIDLEIEINGWVFGENCLEEVEVKGMPNNAGVGFADYVLFGADGKPLAVVEAKKTSVDPKVGQQQVKLYADCLEKEYGVRPVMFYTNGFDYYIWEDESYPPRRTSGLYTRQDLEWLLYRKNERESLEYIEIDDRITNRYYQKEAIRGVCEAFEEGKRKALLVMATGSGKTRTAISVVDVLIKKNWVKNVLFLADRRALVKQAKRNFKNLLPDLSLCNLLNRSEQADSENRMIFSTYPTMMNAIDEVRNEEGDRLFSRGHFDLIIVDESHRSIYKKYQDIFNYFDAMLLGLTATPKNDIDKNTFSIFELQNDEPTYSYELDQAIRDHYLVPYHTIETRMKFMEEGIHYDDLSEKEKDEFEDIFDEDMRDISGSALNQYLFNADTVDQVIQDLMNNGLKVEGGDKLGKTIIFAKNKRHAKFIVGRFNKLYPGYKGKFAKSVYTDIKYVDSLIDKFSDPVRMPQIAVSVDMLDTGIDIHEILNLVFFKKIRSKTKFWQMIGRGTRLCEGLFGYGQDKTEFRIFDYCSNFEFFRVNENGKEAGSSKSLTERLFMSRVEIIKALQKTEFQIVELIEHRNNLISELLEEIKKIDKTLFNANMRLKYIDKYNQVSEFEDITETKLNELDEFVSPLIPAINDDEKAKRFDYLMYQVEFSLLCDYSLKTEKNKVIKIAEKLSEKGSIAVVRKQADIIAEIQSGEFWDHPSLFDLEKVRKVLRELVKFLDYEDTAIYYTNFTDEVLDTTTSQYVLNDKKDYMREVESYLKDNQDNPLFEKVRTLQPLLEEEISKLEQIFWYEIGTKDDYTEIFGESSIVSMLRAELGLEKETVESHFSEFLNDGLNGAQTEFVNLVVDYIAQNGSLERERLLESPFTQWGDLTELFYGKVEVLKEIVGKIQGLS